MRIVEGAHKLTIHIERSSISYRYVYIYIYRSPLIISSLFSLNLKKYVAFEHWQSTHWDRFRQIPIKMHQLRRQGGPRPLSPFQTADVSVPISIPGWMRKENNDIYSFFNPFLSSMQTWSYQTLRMWLTNANLNMAKECSNQWSHEILVLWCLGI